MMTLRRTLKVPKLAQGAVFSLEPFDRKAKTDQQRIARGVPTLKEIEQQLIMYNSQ